MCTFICLLLCLIHIILAQSQSLPTAWTQGIATLYGGAQDGMNPSSPSFGTSVGFWVKGSCGYGLLNPSVYPYWSVAALSTSNKYSLAGPSQGCGQCFEIQCLNSGGQFAGRCSSSQSVIVTITDSCPECQSDQIDMQALTFNKIAPMAIGRIDMQYRRVDCTPPLPVSIAVNNNVGVGGWLRLVVEKTAGFGGIVSVKMRTSGVQSWLAMSNKFGSAWEVSNTPGLPWDFQFTSDSSQTIVASSLIMSNGQVGDIPTGVQFSLSGSSGSATISYDSEAVPPAATSSPPVPPGSGSPSVTPMTPPSPTGCVDVTPYVASGQITCAQQAQYGKCFDPWMVSGNYCQATCGRCPGGQSSSGYSPSTQKAPFANSSPGANGPSTPASGSVQTYSIQAPPPPPPTICSDTNPPGFSSCAAAIASANMACWDHSRIPDGTCMKSCYRC